MTRLFGMLVLAGLFAVAGCEKKMDGPGKVTPEDVKKDVGKAVKTVTEFSEQAKDEFLKKLDAQINDLDAKIGKLQEQGADLTGDAKDKWDKNVADLIEKRDVLMDKMKKAKEATGEAWQEVQKSTQSAWEELDKKLKGIKSDK